jgi:hypothetical protein
MQKTKTLQSNKSKAGSAFYIILKNMLKAKATEEVLV